MANKLSTIGFNAGQSEKQSAEDCINYIPYPSSSNDFNGGAVSLYSTTGIKGPTPSNIPLTNAGSPFMQSVGFSFENVQGAAAGALWAYWNGNIMNVSDRNVSLTPLQGITIGERVNGARFSSGGNLIVVAGTTSIGGDGLSFCQKIENGSQVSPVDISPILGGSPPGQNQLTYISDVAFYGDRFLYLISAPATSSISRRVYFSNVLDPDIPNSNAFIGSTDSSGELIGMHVLNNRLYVFSTNSMYVYTLNNSNTIPFIEQRGSRADFGLISSSCKAELDGSLYFIGSAQGRFGLFVLSGGALSKISTPAVDVLLNRNNWWDSAKDNSQVARVFSFNDAGRSYVAFTFANLTLCYDPETKLYHKRSTSITPGVTSGDWEVCGCGIPRSINLAPSGDHSLFLGSRILREANEDGDMLFRTGRGDRTIGTEFGIVQDRVAISSPYNSDGVTNRVSEIQVISDIDNNPLDLDWPEPQITLSASDDYGYTFTAYPENSIKFGEQGNRNRLLRWLNIGVFRQSFVLKLATRNPYSHQIIKVLANISKGIRQR